MQGARKYVTAIEGLARIGGYGFDVVENNRGIYTKGNFLFHCGEHARGKELSIYLLKKMPPQRIENRMLFETYLNSTNSLLVYGPVSGQLGWSEIYGYLVHNEIKSVLSSILDEAIRDYNDVINDKKEKADAERKEKAIALNNKAKDFEQFLLNGCKETAPEKTSSESEKVLELRSTNPVQNAYDILLEIQENGDMTLIDEAIGYLGQALDESDAEDENIITLEMIKEGLKQGLIIPKVEGDGLKCYIGEYFFFFGGSEFEDVQELSEIPEDVLPIEIRTALNAFNKAENHDFETEYMYYYYYLLENLKDESDTSDLISFDMVKKGIETGVISQSKKDEKFVCLFENEYLFSLQDNGLDETEFEKKVYNFFIELCSSTGPEGDQYLYCFYTLKKLIEHCEEESDAE